MAVSGMAILVSSLAPWEVLARARKAGHFDPLVSNLWDNVGSSGWKMTGGLSWQKIGAASLASSVSWLALVVSLGAVGARVGPQLQQFSDEKPLIQGRLASRNRHAMACTHFTPDQCVHHLYIMRGAGTSVSEGIAFLERSRRRRYTWSSAMVWLMLVINEVLWIIFNYSSFIIGDINLEGVIFVQNLTNWVEYISVAHHGNQRSLSPRTIIGCEFSSGLLKTRVLKAILVVCNFLYRRRFMRYDQQ